MRRLSLYISIILPLLFLASSSAAAQTSATDICGEWLTSDEAGKILIYQATDGTLEGKIV
ncbi:MAG: hypothetical protein IAF08_07060 [Rhizobacter sp.]|nr:hypothetical protein [Chlorobiales bacterium]